MDNYRVGVALLAYTGLRISEACALRWQDVDLVDLELNVCGQLARATRTTPARIVPRKGGADAYPALLFPALETLLVQQLAAEQVAPRPRRRGHSEATEPSPLSYGRNEKPHVQRVLRSGRRDLNSGPLVRSRPFSRSR